ncbi:MAG: glycosyltransferase family 39 protein [Phycisphaerales bacterium]|nr:glycosyltransferase family 39 protein [Phycisphaerales bacterium]
MSDWLAALRRMHPAIVTMSVCAALLLIFWVRAFWAVRQKSSTYDEPMHALGAWVHWHQGDWRINYEDPPLWHYWAALPQPADAIRVDFRSPRWRAMADDWNQQWMFTHEVLYRTDGNDGEAFVRRSRAMMLVLGVALGAIIACWGFQIGGAAAAVFATLLYSLDPNFLAHAPLVKNDVAMALCIAGLCLAIWRMGLRLTPWNLAGAAMASAAAMTSKFSGVLLAPALLTILLLIRVAIPRPWGVWCGRSSDGWLTSWWQRLSAAVGVGVLVALVCVLGVWAAYGFSFPAIPDRAVKLNLHPILQQGRLYQFQSEAKGAVTQEQMQNALLEFIRWHMQRWPEDARSYPEEWRKLAESVRPWRPPASTRLLLWMLDRKLMPEAWLSGLIFVEARSYVRGSYLNGQISNTGFRSYFPLAMAYKTPLATIAAGVASGGVALTAWWLGRRQKFNRAPESADRSRLWLACVLLVPIGLYLWLSIRSNLNIGFRHVLPIYPLIFLLLSWALATALVRWKVCGWTGAGVIALVLAVESIAIAPDYLTFFNLAAGGQRGGLNRLGDSNLDWGQDLPALAQFMSRPENRDSALYLSYFGMADPQAYGLRYLNMPGGYELNPQALWPPAGSLVAISATRLQGIYATPELRAEYAKFRSRTPTAVLGGSIYVYDDRPGRKP